MIANPKEIISNEGIWCIFRIKLLVSVGLFNNLYVYKHFPCLRLALLKTKLRPPSKTHQLVSVGLVRLLLLFVHIVFNLAYLFKLLA